ncbi:serine/threonine protein kinase [Enteractinococcus coprophilus]|uniref:non-specific serine/threonine protein kinase n=1 Tax=Enteractinococcus coprophilus TaxID=1027633 RepID=A0A543AJP6_9MICC|nr:serine/threonine-protein kinase [Enteractinococcus coprophilus]TQL72813.1 serine/threonine protein kinase [Enteractinococcus coprophilus]
MNVPIANQTNALLDRVPSRLAPTPLQTLKQWEVVKHLGSGTSAEVWLLEDEARCHKVACKTPHRGLGTEDLSHEAELAAQLSQENILKPFDVGNDPELSLLEDATFWEFLAGGTLTELVSATGRLSLAQTVTVMLPMIQATKYLQARQIVHGDISPRNIMFDLTGRPVLIDFGAVRATAHDHVRTGTPGFVAPELLLPPSQHQGLEAYADIYALAAVAWFCLSGTVPGSVEHRVPITTLQPELDHDIVEALEAGLNADPTLRPDLDHLLATVAQWAEPEPVDLHASVGEDYGLVLPTRQPQHETPRRRWFRRQNPSKVSSRRGPRCKTSRKKPRSHRSRRLSVALGAFFLAGGVAVTVAYDSNRAHESSESKDEAPQVAGQQDFQAVIDALAKARSATWEAGNPEQVGEYALVDSSVFRDDVELLTVLSESRHHLEGVRMRAVVEDVELSGELAVVTATWQIDGYVQRDQSGKSIRQTSSSEETIEIEIVDTVHGWRIAAVR